MVASSSCWPQSCVFVGIAVGMTVFCMGLLLLSTGEIPNGCLCIILGGIIMILMGRIWRRIREGFYRPFSEECINTELHEPDSRHSSPSAPRTNPHADEPPSYQESWRKSFLRQQENLGYRNEGAAFEMSPVTYMMPSALPTGELPTPRTSEQVSLSRAVVHKDLNNSRLSPLSAHRLLLGHAEAAGPPCNPNICFRLPSSSTPEPPSYETVVANRSRTTSEIVQ